MSGEILKCKNCGQRNRVTPRASKPGEWRCGACGAYLRPEHGPVTRGPIGGATEFVRHSHPKGWFELDYPRGWVRREQDENDIVALSCRADDWSALLEVMHFAGETVDDGHLVDTLAEGLLVTTGEEGREHGRWVNRSDLTFGNAERARYLISVYRERGQDNVTQFVVLGSGVYALVVALKSPRAAYERNQANFTNVLRSLRARWFERDGSITLYVPAFADTVVKPEYAGLPPGIVAISQMASKPSHGCFGAAALVLLSVVATAVTWTDFP